MQQQQQQQQQRGGIGFEVKPLQAGCFISRLRAL
jgi:hypothetical protein